MEALANRKTNKQLDPRHKTPKKTNLPTANTLRTALTLVMGCFIPTLSLALSYTGGHLWENHPILSALAFTLMLCVLSVSLDHLRWAIKDITKSHEWASWLLAVAFDLALVLGELCHISADDAHVGIVTTALMIAVCGLSMFLNCWAFFKAPQAEAKAQKKAGRQPQRPVK